MRAVARAFAAAPLAELLKLVRMIRLAARHSTTRRLALAAVVSWLVRQLVRTALRQRAAEKLALELCAESEQLGMRRVQSVQARLETIHEAHPRARVADSGSNMIRRAQSVGNLVRHGIFHGNGSSKLPFGSLAVNLEELALCPGLRKQKLCGDCLSRCTSALSLASLEAAAASQTDGGTGSAEEGDARSGRAEGVGPLDGSPVGRRGLVAADRTVRRTTSVSTLSATGSAGNGSTGSLSLSTGQLGSSGCLESLLTPTAASARPLSPPLLTTLEEDSMESLKGSLDDPEEITAGLKEGTACDKESIVGLKSHAEVTVAPPAAARGAEGTLCMEAGAGGAIADLARPPMLRRQSIPSSQDLEVLANEFGTRTLDRTLARVAARLEAESANPFLDARGAGTSPLGPACFACEGCVACISADTTWRAATSRVIGAAAAAAAAYCVWLRFVARRDVALRHCMGFVRRLGQLFRYRVHGLEHLPESGAAMVYCYHGFIPLDMYFFQEAVWRCTGRLPRVLVADFVFRIPFFSWMVRLGGGVPAGRRAALEQLRRGELVVVAPGGVREGMSSTNQDYAVNWFGRQGFAETAQTAGVPLIPMCTRNVRELFLVLGGSLPLVLKLYRLTKLPFTPFIGPLLVPLTTLVGAPLAHDPDRTPAQVTSLAKRALEALLQRAMDVSGAPLD